MQVESTPIREQFVYTKEENSLTIKIKKSYMPEKNESDKSSTCYIARFGTNWKYEFDTFMI